MSKDVKRMVGEIRQSLEAYPREQLVEILSYVFKEYVVEGAAPIAGTTALIDARTELEGLSFAELVTWLQLHLDMPELAQLEVQGARVFLRAAGRAIPIEAARAEPPAATPPVTAAQPTPAANAPRPMPVTATPSVISRPMPGTPQAQPQSQPPTSSQASTQSSSPPSVSQPSTPSPQSPAPAQAQSGAEKKEESDAAASRFSWLEVD